ncbi:methylmalonyl-CoA mutase subunit beta [Formosa sp. S-31]|uniref:methylmalonyl-CoA mutase subunit beta n=1 Tax=Formosa sp. S-31 TaxID=2790949 RepID=UPI003EBFFEF2
MSKTNLFDEFQPVSAKSWKQLIQFDLKGKDYNDTLIWQSLEGINVKPFYSQEDLNSESFENEKSTPWHINEAIYVNNEKSANSKAFEAINSGSESFTFVIPSPQCNLDTLLKNLPLEQLPIYFELKFLSHEFVITLNNFAKSKNAIFFVNLDPIGYLTETGNWFYGLQKDLDHLQTMIDTCKNLKSTLSINAGLYQNAGATMVQQLAYALAHVNEYLVRLNNLNPEFIVFKVNVGSNYFFEIAKLKALRLLWSTLTQALQIQCKCHILAGPTKRNKTIFDSNTNLLRSTTECMSAVLGGADSVFNLDHDALFKKENNFSRRLSRNQLLIIKHESAFNKVNNPTEGAYFISSLTEQLAEKSLALFKDLEANGGFLTQLKAGIIQKKIKESARKEQELYDNNEIVLVGTNYQEISEDLEDRLELYPFMKINPRKTLLEPIITKRLAENTEQQRLK